MEMVSVCLPSLTAQEAGGGANTVRRLEPEIVDVPASLLGPVPLTEPLAGAATPSLPSAPVQSWAVPLKIPSKLLVATSSTLTLVTADTARSILKVLNDWA